MNVDTAIDAARYYITGRLVPEGGFCFYYNGDVADPNLSDTYYAIASLKLLGEKFDHGPTREYLLSAQKADGSYSGIYRAYYAVMALSEMGMKPLVDPSAYVVNYLKSVPLEMVPGRLSVFSSLYPAVALVHELGVKVPEILASEIAGWILAHRHEDGGFGGDRSTVIDTALAIEIQRHLNRIEDWVEKGARDFLDACVWYNGCHTYHPGYGEPYIEHVHAGVRLSRVFGDGSPGKGCLKYILRCQNINGGFARSPAGGISTLENTYYALEALSPFRGIDW